MTIRAAAAALLALGLVGPACGPEGGGAPAPTVPGPPTTPVAGEVLATCTRTGGVAGRRFQVVVRPDGSFEGGSGTPGRGHLAAAALDELRRLVAAYVGAAPRPAYGRAVPDGFTTTLTAGPRTTEILTDGSPPAEVQSLVTFLAGLERLLPPR